MLLCVTLNGLHNFMFVQLSFKFLTIDKKTENNIYQFHIGFPLFWASGSTDARDFSIEIFKGNTWNKTPEEKRAFA